ncbi:hypothetical protein [Sorangium sp. So ce887]|uniref:hypothetical protein n=1 Tax=Sorangium sp. So ce887 TaxID=3133324 RepID=UPI003F61DB93
MRMVFRGGAAYGPNGRFGAWVVSVDAGGSVTLAGQALGEEIHRGPEPLSESELAALDRLLGGAAAVDAASKRMGVPGETQVCFDIETPAGRREIRLWQREAQERPPLVGLLRWLDEVIQARTGRFAAFGS